MTLIITGVLEHNMVSSCALIMTSSRKKFTRVINFGCAGVYTTAVEGSGDDIRVGEAYLVGRSERFDVDDNTHWTRSFPLHIPTLQDKETPKLLIATCITGSRYSTPRDRMSPHFPKGDIEDMELYGLASLCEALKTPLIAVKYGVNYVDGTHQESREQLRKNIIPMRSNAMKILFRVLEAKP
jgi:nucleoside phosphorylase